MFRYFFSLRAGIYCFFRGRWTRDYKRVSEQRYPVILCFDFQISLFKLSVAYPLRRYMSRWATKLLIYYVLCGYYLDLLKDEHTTLIPCSIFQLYQRLFPFSFFTFSFFFSWLGADFY
jgi:hypothetical protein